VDQRTILLDLQTLFDKNLLLSSDKQATSHIHERTVQLKQLHLQLEQKVNQLRVRCYHMMINECVCVFAFKRNA
jgi:hypothetical protein